MTSVRIFCLTFLLLVPCATRADEDDWSVTRSPFDRRVVQRYKGMLLANPHDGYALGKLVELYRRHRTLAALIKELRSGAGAQSFAGQVILGHLHGRTGELQEAAGYYKRACELRPKSAATHAALGAIYRRMGKNEEAQATYDRALELARSKERKSRVLRALADIALADRDPALASKHLKRILDLTPGDARLKLDLAQALVRAGSFEQALRHYQDLLKASSDSARRAELLKEIGDLQQKLKRPDEAVRAFRQAMALTAGGHWLRRELTDRIISIYREREDLKSLIAEYEKQWSRRGPFEEETLGRLYEETSDEAKALEHYRSAIRAAPHAVQIRLRVISLLDRTGRSDEVVDEYRGLVRIAPGEPKFQVELAKRLYQAGNEKEALQVLQRCGRRFSGDASVHSVLADLFTRWGDPQRAMRSASLLLRIEPNDPSHIINLGEQHFLEGKQKKAMEVWKRLLHVIPKQHEALARLAEVYGAHNMTAQAEALYRRAIKLSPRTLSYRRSLAVLLENSRRTSDALKAWEELMVLARAQGSQPAVKESRGHIINILHASYRLRDHMRVLKAMFEARTPDIEAGFFLAEAHVKRGEYEGAYQVYKGILNLQSNNLDALLALEQVCRRQRRLREAVEMLKRLAELQPGNARDYYQRIADLLLQLYDDKEALVWAHRAVAAGSKDASAYQRLGELYEKKEDYAGAMEAYKQAISLNPQHHPVYFALARLHSLHGQHSEAEGLYLKVMKSASTPEWIRKSFNLVLPISNYLGTLASLEKELLPLAITSLNAEHFKQMLVQVYRRRIPLLIHQVRRGESTTRKRATEELRRIGQRGLPPLLEELGRDTASRLEIIRMLGYLGNEGAVLPLVRIAEKQEEEVLTIYGHARGGSLGLRRPGFLLGSLSRRSSRRRSQVDREVEAAVAVGRIASERGVAGLVLLLKGGEGPTREAASWALSRIRSPAGARALFSALGDSRSVVQMMACTGLGLQADPEMRPVLEEVMLDRARDEAVRAACAWGLGALGDPQAADSLAVVLQSGDDELQRCAAWSLGMLGDARSVAQLVRALWSKRNPVRQAIVWALVHISSGSRLPRPTGTPDVLVKDGRIDADDFLFRLTREVDELQGAALALGLTQVIRAHRQAISSGLQAALARHRDVVLRVLSDLSRSPDALTLGPLTTGRDKLEPKKRAELDRAVREACRPVVGELARLLSHQDPLIRARAIMVRTKMGTPDLVRALRQALRDPQRSVRVSALMAIRAAFKARTLTPAETLSLVRGPLTTGTWREREAATAVAAALGSPEAGRLLHRATRDLNGFVREAAVSGLGQIPGEAFRGPLLKALEDEIAPVRAAACRSLASLRATAALPKIQLLLKDPDPVVRGAARTALQRLR